MYYLSLFIYFLVTLLSVFIQKKEGNAIFCGFAVYFFIVNRDQFMLHFPERKNVLLF